MGIISKEEQRWFVGMKIGDSYKNHTGKYLDSEIRDDIVCDLYREFHIFRKESKGTFIWRLTAPVLWLVYGALLAFIPIKYIFTGKGHYSWKWLIKWADKLGI